MISGWQNRGDYWTIINSPGFVLKPRSRGYLETQKPVSSGLRGVKKNNLRMLRNGSQKFLRPQGSAYSGSTLRRDADLPASADQTCYVPQVPEGETRKASLAIQQPFLHKAFRFLCWKAVPEDERSGRSPRAEAGLAYGQRLGDAIHEGSASAYRYPWSPGNWH